MELQGVMRGFLFASFLLQELVKLLHKALEAAQQEKRESCRYLATTEEKDRLELIRHKVRQIAELSKRVEALEVEKEALEQNLALKEGHVDELQAHVQVLMDKNQAKQEVILKLTEQVTRDVPESLMEADTIASETLYKQQEEMEHLKVLSGKARWGNRVKYEVTRSLN